MIILEQYRHHLLEFLNYTSEDTWGGVSKIPAKWEKFYIYFLRNELGQGPTRGGRIKGQSEPKPLVSIENHARKTRYLMPSLKE